MCNFIEENSVSGINLSLELEKAVIQHNLCDDGDLYITEDDFYPLWIKTLKDRGYIAFTTNTLFRRNVSHTQRLEICNEINRQSYLLSAYISANDDRLKIDHIISYRDGLMTDMFIRVLRKFSSSLKHALNNIDSNNDMVMMPGQTEDQPSDSDHE